MNTYFKVLLENATNDAALKYLEHVAYVNGEHSTTERGKAKDKEKHEPLKETARVRLIELLNLNFPEFKGRFRHIYYHVNKDHCFVAVNRAIPEDDNADPFAQ